MCIRNACITFIFIAFITSSLQSQTSNNCFLEDFYYKYTASPPYYIDTIKPSITPNITITLLGQDTLGKISPYMMGNAAAVWVGTNINNPTVVGYLQLLSPPLIRFPGGSWSDIYFWNTLPDDIPDSTYRYEEGVWVKRKFWPQVGSWYPLTPAEYYNMLDQVSAGGLITINYGYARYGLSEDPVAKAAHLAADWVRYDNGFTKFWEIGNENAGVWEEGYMIDTTTNKDGQPHVISGKLYGKHFKVFYDSMKSAAAEIGVTIYIGGQILHKSSTDSVEQAWNQGFFAEVGDTVDFYVFHNYFGGTGPTIKILLDNTRTEILNNLSFIYNDIAAKGAANRPIALTEWNCSDNNPTARISIGNGMQAIIVLGEMMKQNAGMTCRWLIANWDTDGMFYYKDQPDPGLTLWSPRPDFYYLYYFKNILGDHCINTSVTGSPSASDVLAYAFRFSSGHTGVVLMNKNSNYDQKIKVIPQNIPVGDYFYVYTLTGTGANTNLPDSVVVNNYLPSTSHWGPIDNLINIPAYRYSMRDSIILNLPRKTTHFILIDGANSEVTDVQKEIPVNFSLSQNYPNPFNARTQIKYTLAKPSLVTLKVYNVCGAEVATIIRNEYKNSGQYSIAFDASNLTPSLKVNQKSCFIT